MLSVRSGGVGIMKTAEESTEFSEMESQLSSILYSTILQECFLFPLS